MKSLGILGLAIACLAGAWTALKGIRAPREKLLEMSSLIGTKNPVLARIVCWVAFIPLSLAGIGMFGGAAFLGFKVIQELGTSEQSQVEQIVRDGIKEKTGRTAENLILRGQASGKYIGTASVGSDTWDVTATVEKNQIRWEALERTTTTTVERTARDLIRQQTGHEAQSLTLTQQPGGKYKGTAVVNGVRHNVTATVVGRNIECVWEPADG